jgi:hypothetical protein
MGAKSEGMEKGEVVCDDARYKMQDACQNSIMYPANADGVISKSQLPNHKSLVVLGFWISRFSEWRGAE